MATHFSFLLLLPMWFCLITFFQFMPAFAKSKNYIVQMDLSAMPKAFSGHHSWYSSTLASVLDATTTPTTNSPKLLYSYTHVLNGFSASLTPSELEVLKHSPGYISHIRDSLVKKDTTHSLQFLGLSPQSGAWNVSNYGEGVIIGLVDSGVWPESASYRDDGMPNIPNKWKGECEIGTKFNSSMCNKKLIGARFFNRGLVAQNPNITISVNSTRDTDGHGTHTSTTAAGNFVEGASYFGYASGTSGGVAPRAHVAMYKALWDDGAYSSDIIAAIDQAIIDGVDVLSLSLGQDGLPLYMDPIAMATFAAVEKNIFVSTSAGNEGPFFETLHNGAPWQLTVAAGTIDREFGAILRLGNNGDSVTGLSLYSGDFSSGQFPFVFQDLCLNTKNLNKLGRKIIVCQDRNNSISDQIFNIRNANVTAGIFITNETDLEFLIQNPFPAVFLDPKKGELIKQYIKSATKPQASLEFKKTFVGTKMAPRVTSYSSRGPSPSCPTILKPDLMAPGSLILASWPSNVEVEDLDNSQKLFSSFNLISGTSMACPHVAGVAALVKKAHPDWTPAAIRSAMMTTADTTDHNSASIKDLGNGNQPATPLVIGAGQVNPNKALDPGLVYDASSTDYVKLLCALNYTQGQIQNITKSPSNDCSNPSLDLNYPSFIAFFNSRNQKPDSTTVKEFQRTVTNVGAAISTYIANVAPIKELNVSVIPDRLEFKTKNQKLRYKLRIEGPSQLKETVSFGYLSWVETTGKYVVKSPIAATSLIPEPLLKSHHN